MSALPAFVAFARASKSSSQGRTSYLNRGCRTDVSNVRLGWNADVGAKLAQVSTSDETSLPNRIVGVNDAQYPVCAGARHRSRSTKPAIGRNRSQELGQPDRC